MSACYWLEMSHQLLGMIDPPRMAGAGLRIVPDAPRIPATDHTAWVMVRDEGAPAELHDLRVDIDVTVMYTRAHPEGRAMVTGRRVRVA